MGQAWHGPLEKIDDYRWRIPQSYDRGMRVPGLVFASEKLLNDIVRDQSLQQVANVAHLPGIVTASLAMPDIHWGYGAPIGGVAAMDIEGGVVAPGMIGYDINCGVRMVKTDLMEDDVRPKLKTLVATLFNTIPCGVGMSGDIRFSQADAPRVMTQGSRWAVAHGYGVKEDLGHTESSGCLEGADPDAVSDRAVKRGQSQLGTLGSGNHFLEVQVVETIFNPTLGDAFGLQPGQVTIMMHSGSRGFGYQICEDSLGIVEPAMRRYGISVPDRQLACVPIRSEEGQQYLGAIRCAANFAWANRQCLMHLARQAFERVFGKSWEALGMQLLYDVAHNIAKFERYAVDGKERTLCVHRKGATRAFPPGHPEIPAAYREIGQPVIIPGDMGRNSYLLVGTQRAMEETFGTVCFAGETPVLTDEGLVPIAEIYELAKVGKRFRAATLNTAQWQIEWKPVIDTMRRSALTARVCVSQTGRSRFGILTTTLDHRFGTINNCSCAFEPIRDLIASGKAVCVLDQLPGEGEIHDPELAYVTGAIVSDGYARIYEGGRHGSVSFFQKKTEEKLEFIYRVCDAFQAVFGTGLTEYPERRLGGVIRGKAMSGVSSEFVCCQKGPAKTILSIRQRLESWVLSLNHESVWHFLAGVVDGDGTWNPAHHVIDIFNIDPTVTKAVVLACLRLGILPYVSKQRGNCFIIQISERRRELLQFSARLKAEPRERLYGTKMFAIRQLFAREWKEGSLRWPFRHKASRNGFMDAGQIRRAVAASRYAAIQPSVNRAINAPFRMHRVCWLPGDRPKVQDVYNVTVEDHHNYVVFTEMFTPVIVSNCHGAGRVMSRSQAVKEAAGRSIEQELAREGIIVMGRGRKGIAEEQPMAYKDVNDVVRVVDGAGLATRVARMRPLGVIKG